MNTRERIEQLKSEHRRKIEAAAQKEREDAERDRQLACQQIQGAAADYLRRNDLGWLVELIADNTDPHIDEDEGWWVTVWFEIEGHRRVGLVLTRLSKEVSWSVRADSLCWVGMYRNNRQNLFDSLAEALITSEMNDDIPF